VGSERDDRGRHTHARLTGVTNLIGKTTIRELIVLIYHARGVLTGLTLPFMIAQAFWKPMVILAGSRESYCWQATTRDNPALSGRHALIKREPVFLHTAGSRPCARPEGCWTCQIVPPHRDSAFPPGFLCQSPEVDSTGQPVTGCLLAIAPERVAAAVLTENARD
jgi:hypothetical protein